MGNSYKMNKLQKQVQRHTVANANYYCGTGWVTIPSGATRSEAVQTALRTSRVTLLTHDGGFHTQVLCDQSIMSQLTFPDTFMQKGSCVAWICVPVYNRIIIVAHLQAPDGGSLYEEGEYQYGRADSMASSLINGNGSRGTLSISTSSMGSGSLIDISATNTEATDVRGDGGSSVIKLRVNGRMAEEIRGFKESKITQSSTLEIESGEVDTLKTTIKADRESVSVSIVNEAGSDEEETIVSLAYNKDEGLTYKDQYENEIIANETNIQVKAKEAVNLGEGTEPVVLGDTLKATLEDLISAIKAITVPTAMGPSGTPINFAQFDAINAQLSNILSQYSKTD